MLDRLGNTSESYLVQLLPGSLDRGSDLLPNVTETVRSRPGAGVGGEIENGIDRVWGVEAGVGAGAGVGAELESEPALELESGTGLERVPYS